MVYNTVESDGERVDLSALDVIAAIRSRHPDFAPGAYLNGTQRADTFKWLLTLRLGSKKRIYGYPGARFLEMVQAGHHWFKRRYLAYVHPRTLRFGRSMLALWPIDRGIRRALGRALTDPRVLFNRIHLQSIMVISPVDFLPDGRQDMCDGCPDMTVWEGDLAWSCRLEECKQFGQFVHSVPKSDEQRPVASETH